MVAVETDVPRQLELRGQVERGVQIGRPGEVALAVGQVAGLRIEARGEARELGRRRGGVIEGRSDPIAGVPLVAGRDVAVRAIDLAAGDPAEPLAGRRGEAQLLGQGADPEELALVLVVAREQVKQALLRRQEVEGVAGDDLLGQVVAGDRGQGPRVGLVVHLQRGVIDRPVVLARVVHPDRQGGIVHVRRLELGVVGVGRTGVEVQPGVIDDVVVEALGPNPVAGKPEVGLELVARRPDEAQAAIQVLPGIGLLVQKGVLEVAGGVGVGDAGHHAEGAGQRTGDHRLALAAGPGVVAGGDVPLPHRAGLLGGDQNGPADGVAPVERALRALHHLDLGDVEQFLIELRGLGLGHAIDDHRHRRLGVPGLGDAADHHEGGADVLGLHQGDVGRRRDEVARHGDALVADRLGGEGGHLHGRLLQGFRALAGGDDHLADLGRLGRRGAARLGVGEARNGEGRDARRRAQQRAHSVFGGCHCSLPRDFG